MLRVKLERVVSAHPYVYYRDSGRVFMHASKREARYEGREAAYLLEIASGRVWRLTNGRQVRVTAVEFA